MSKSQLLGCPDCGHKNIAGAETCEDCGQSLAPVSTPGAAHALEKQIVQDRIAKLQPKQAVTVQASMSVGEVLQLLVQQRIGCALVMKGEQVVGIFTERDALFKLNTECAQLAKQPVSNFMTDAPETLRSKDRIAYALHKMDLGGYRHVPILDENQSPQIISIRDILRYMTDFCSV